MARIFPATLPTYIRSNPLRSAECRVFDKLDAQLPDTYTVFYSRPWLGLTPDGREIDGEADFVVAHAEHGLLTLEVKGGRVARNTTQDRWTSRDRDGVVHVIKDPVAQAMRSKHEILHKLKDHDAWDARFIQVAHGVVLPDSSNPGRDLGAEMPLRIFAFAGDMGGLGDWVQRRMKPPEGDTDPPFEPLGQDGLNALELLLARSFELQVPLSSALALEDEAIRHMTEEQFHILEYVKRVKRCAVEGGAGSGKTVLALELAADRAKEGEVLIICFNRPLAHDAQRRLAGFPRVRVSTFHGFCFSMARETGLDPEAVPSGDNLDKHALDLLMGALEADSSPRFDVIVIDEGQDFQPQWIAALELCLRDENESELYVFYDSNQQVYSGSTGLSGLATPPFPLTRNLRNTHEIFDLARPYYAGPRYVAAGPEGREVEWVEAREGDELNAVMQALGKLTKTERVLAENIAVLADTHVVVERLRNHLAGRYVLTDAEGLQQEALIVDTVRRFKGLERQVVVLVLGDDVLDAVETLYVGLTRARLHLVMIGEPEVMAGVRNRV